MSGQRGNPNWRGQRVDYRAEIARLDALSRTRALTDAESIMLERFLWRVRKKGARRASYGTNKDLARAGLKRPRSDEELLHLSTSQHGTQHTENPKEHREIVEKPEKPFGDNTQAGA